METNTPEEDEDLCGDRCCSISGFMLLLVFAVLFISLYAALHGIFLDVVHIFGVPGAFGGIYVILILDVICSLVGMIVCCEGLTKCVLIIIYIVLSLNCVVNAFVGIFITTGIKKLHPLPPLPTLTLNLTANSDKSLNCMSIDNEDCRKLNIIQIGFYVMYLQLLVRLLVLFTVRRAFLIDGSPSARARASLGVPVFIQRRLHRPPRFPTVQEVETGSRLSQLEQSHSVIN